jgi:CheY-specific phosphatase CheX
MNQSDWNKINTMLVECATALMGAFGTTVVHNPGRETFPSLQDGILAIIGFGGDQIRGSLVLSASRGILTSSCPVENTEGVAASDILQDWGGELANQLLGRLKSRLLAHNVTILLGTPTTVSGLDLRVRTLPGEVQFTPLWLYAGNDWLVVRLNAVATGEVGLSDSPDAGTTAKEGDILLF